MEFSRNRSILSALIVILVCCLCVSSVSEAHEPHHGCNHDHGGGHFGHDHDSVVEEIAFKLPEERAEEEFLRTHGFSSHRHDDHHLDDGVAPVLSSAGLWFQALGCSLLVSMASLICLIILPVIFIKGKPSKEVVDALALFGAGAMLGDAFLHQLPHAFGGEHSESGSHGHHMEHDHHHEDVHNHSHSHSLKDLSVGLSILGGIVLFLIVEKIVRYVEDHSDGNSASIHGHHHHNHSSNKKSKDATDDAACLNTQSLKKGDGKVENVLSETGNGEKTNPQESLLRKRSSTSSGQDEKKDSHVTDEYVAKKSLLEEQSGQSPSNLVFGYLNLFSDGVHNFTDGMALGSAFLLYGSVGGWSRTLFLLAHELPQEVGDFGILVRSGFSVSKALFFNFLSALVALAGTALVLLWGQSPGQSSIIEGFTAGGFIYIAVAGVLAEMNSNGSTKLKSTAIQLVSLILGMTVALCISLVE